jgi:hypothetical protein
VVNLGQLVGALVGGYSGAVHGPRMAVLVTSLAQALGWAAIAAAPNLTCLCLGRVLGRIRSWHWLFESLSYAIHMLVPRPKTSGGVGVIHDFCRPLTKCSSHTLAVPPLHHHYNKI